MSTTAPSNVVQRKRIAVQHHLVIWVDSNINLKDEHYQNILSQLQNIINDVYTFIEYDDCVDFLTEVDDRQVLLILPDISDNK